MKKIIILTLMLAHCFWVKAQLYTATGTTLHIDNGAVVSVNNTDVTLNSSITGTGTGKLVFKGNSLQNIINNGHNIFGLEIDNSADVLLNYPLQIDGTLTLTNGALRVNDKILTLNGTSSVSTGTITGSSLSELVLGGTVNGNTGTLSFTNGLGNNIFKNITINRIGAGATVSLGNALNVVNAVIPLSGTLASGGNLIIAPTASVLPSGGNITGNVVIQQFITGQRGFRVFGNPFTTSQSLATLASSNGIVINTTAQVSGLTDARLFHNSTNNWTNAGISIAAGTPYALFIRGLATEVSGANYIGGPTPFTFNASGTLNSYTNGTGYTMPAATNGSNFTIVGNPFAAPVTTAGLTNGAGVSYYVYTIERGNNLITQRIKAGNWMPVLSSSTTTTIPNLGVIAWKQPEVSYTIPTSAISTTGTLQTGLFGAEKDIPNIELLVEKDSVYQDKLFIRWDEKATDNSNDNTDLEKFYNDNVNVYTKAANGNNLGVDARKNINNVPLGISAAIGNYSFKIANNSMPKGTVVTLLDKLQNTKTELQVGNKYNFSITTDTATKGEHRFMLNFTQKTITPPIDPQIITTGFTAKVLGNLINGKTVKVQVAGSTTPVTIMVVDVQGKVLQTINTTNGVTTVNVSNTANGLIIFKITNGVVTVIEKVVAL